MLARRCESAVCVSWGFQAVPPVPRFATLQILVDSRRGKVLRKLLSLLNQPGMVMPISQIKVRIAVQFSAAGKQRSVRPGSCWCSWVLLRTPLPPGIHILPVLSDTLVLSDKFAMLPFFVDSGALCWCWRCC